MALLHGAIAGPSHAHESYLEARRSKRPAADYVINSQLY